MTGEIEGWQVLLAAGVGILPTVYIGLVILTLATWINSRDKGRLPAQLFPNRHTYFPYGYTTAYKVSRFIVYDIFLRSAFYDLAVSGSDRQQRRSVTPDDGSMDDLRCYEDRR